MLALQAPAQVVATVTLPATSVLADADGRVVVLCEADGRGALAGCALRAESPAGHGFGGTAFKAAKAMRIPPEAASAGTVVDVPFVFTATPAGDE